jgi:acetyl esterase/lipase
LTATVTGTPPYLRPFVLDTPVVQAERHGNVDIYRPAGNPASAGHPVVVFVHGGPIPADLRPTPRDWPVYVGYGSAAAERDVVGVVVDHRLHSDASYPTAAGDVRAAVEKVRGLQGVDGQRVGLWFFSGGGLLMAEWLADPPSWLTCVAATYPVLAPLPGRDVPSPFQPMRALAHAGQLPLLLTRVGQESPDVEATVRQFMATARARAAPLSVIDVVDGQHGFDMLDHDDASRRAISEALTWVTRMLHPEL